MTDGTVRSVEEEQAALQNVLSYLGSSEAGILWSATWAWLHEQNDGSLTELIQLWSATAATRSGPHAQLSELLDSYALFPPELKKIFVAHILDTGLVGGDGADLDREVDRARDRERWIPEEHATPRPSGPQFYVPPSRVFDFKWAGQVGTLRIPDAVLEGVQPEEQETLIRFVPAGALLKAQELVAEVEDEALHGFAKPALGALLGSVERLAWKVARKRLSVHRLRGFVDACNRVAVTHRVPRLLVLRELTELVRLYENGGLQTTVVEHLSRFRREITLAWPGGMPSESDFLDTGFGSLGSAGGLGSLG